MHDPQWTDGEAPRLLIEVLSPEHYSYTLSAVPYFVAGVVMVLTAALVLYLERGNRVSRRYFGYASLFGLWSIGRGLVRMSDEPEAIIALTRVCFILVGLAVPLLFQFACFVNRSEARHARLIRFSWGIGVALSLFSFTTPWMVNGWRVTSGGIEPSLGWAGWLLIGWCAALLVLALRDTWQARQQSAKGSREHARQQVFLVALGALSLGLTDFLVFAGVPIWALTSLSGLLFSMLTAYITWRYGLVEITTEMAAEQIAAMVRRALLILDADGVVQVVNERTARIFGLEADQLVGHQAELLLGEVFRPDKLRRMAQLEGVDEEKEFIHQPEGAPLGRDLAMSVVSMKDKHQRHIGFVCLVRDVTQVKRAQQQRLAEGLRDALTQLPNRAMFLGLLDAVVKHHREVEDGGFAVCFVGLDRLRVINEDLGYGMGDQVLFEMAGRLSQIVRPQDTVARIGGDEFGILMPDAPSTELQHQFVSELDRSLRAPMELADHKLYLSASIGVASSEFEYASGADVLRNASVAMYKVKENGGGASRWVTAEDLGTQRTRLESDLRRALENDEFVVHYQPVVDLRERRVIGFEALIRWQHPERGMVPPMEFIEFAEDIGLIGEIDAWVFAQSCRDLQEFMGAAAGRQLSVSVNMAEGELQDPAFIGRVRNTMEAHGLAAHNVRFELLERVAMSGPVSDTLTALRELGLDVCIDDFGTGYSSLSRLHELPITVLKIDRAFVRAMSLGEGGDKVIASIIALARSLGLKVIAEGAGSAEDVRQLYALGCMHIQGFYFSPGVAREEVVHMLTHPEQLLEQIEALRPA